MGDPKSGTIDFSDLGGKPVQAGPVDFSDLGGRPVQAASQDTSQAEPSWWDKIKAFRLSHFGCFVSLVDC